MSDTTSQIDQHNEQRYMFSQDWFSHNIPALNDLFARLKPKRVLEIGSFEGRSTIHFMEQGSQYQPEMEIYCVDTWHGALEHHALDMNQVEQRYWHNIHLASQHFPQINLEVCKGTSHQIMMSLLTQGYANYFDFIYIDGSHEAPDVLFDALLAHRLVRVGGVMAFDDYLWSPTESGEEDHYLLVKPAVDHYVNTYQRKVSVLQMRPLYQLYVQKLMD